MILFQNQLKQVELEFGGSLFSFEIARDTPYFKVEDFLWKYCIVATQIPLLFAHLIKFSTEFACVWNVRRGESLNLAENKALKLAWISASWGFDRRYGSKRKAVLGLRLASVSRKTTLWKRARKGALLLQIFKYTEVDKSNLNLTSALFSLDRWFWNRLRSRYQRKLYQNKNRRKFNFIWL